MEERVTDLYKTIHLDHTDRRAIEHHLLAELERIENTSAHDIRSPTARRTNLEDQRRRLPKPTTAAPTGDDSQTNKHKTSEHSASPTTGLGRDQQAERCDADAHDDRSSDGQAEEANATSREASDKADKPAAGPRPIHLANTGTGISLKALLHPPFNHLTNHDLHHTARHNQPRQNGCDSGHGTKPASTQRKTPIQQADALNHQTRSQTMTLMMQVRIRTSWYSSAPLLLTT